MTGLDWSLHTLTTVQRREPNDQLSMFQYTNLATANPQNPGVSTSNYEIPHRFTFRATYTSEIMGYENTMTLFATRNEGRPYSFTMSDGCIR